MRFVFLFNCALFSNLPNDNREADKHCIRRIIYIDPIILTAYDYEIILFYFLAPDRKRYPAKHYCHVLRKIISEYLINYSLHQKVHDIVNCEFKIFWSEIQSNFDEINAEHRIKKKRQSLTRISMNEFCAYGSKIFCSNILAYQNIRSLISSVYKMKTSNIRTDCEFSPTDLDNFFAAHNVIHPPNYIYCDFVNTWNINTFDILCFAFSSMWSGKCHKYHILNLENLCDHHNLPRNLEDSIVNTDNRGSRLVQDTVILHDMVLYLIYKITNDKIIFFVTFQNTIESEKFIKGLENALLIRYKKFKQINPTCNIDMPILERILLKTADIKDHECFTNYFAVKNFSIKENFHFCFDNIYIFNLDNVLEICEKK